MDVSVHSVYVTEPGTSKWMRMYIVLDVGCGLVINYNVTVTTRQSEMAYLAPRGIQYST